MENTYQIFHGQLFTPLFPILCAVFSLIIGFRLQKNTLAFRLFGLYMVAYISIYAITIILDLLGIPQNTHELIFNNIDNAFTLLEFCSYMIFFSRILTQKNTLYWLSIFYFLFYSFLTIRSNINGSINQADKNIIYTVQSALLLIPCVIYYVNIFRNIPNLILENELSFWITTGLFSMQFGILPFSLGESYLVAHYLKDSVVLFSIYNIFYGINFLLITRAYICKPTSQIL